MYALYLCSGLLFVSHTNNLQIECRCHLIEMIVQIEPLARVTRAAKMAKMAGVEKIRGHKYCFANDTATDMIDIVN